MPGNQHSVGGGEGGLHRGGFSRRGVNVPTLMSRNATFPRIGLASQIENGHDFQLPRMIDAIKDPNREAVEPIFPYAWLNLWPTYGGVKYHTNRDISFNRKLDPQPFPPRLVKGRGFTEVVNCLDNEAVFHLCRSHS